jgi:hypothetical protein
MYMPRLRWLNHTENDLQELKVREEERRRGICCKGSQGSYRALKPKGE